MLLGGGGAGWILLAPYCEVEFLSLVSPESPIKCTDWYAMSAVAVVRR